MKQSVLRSLFEKDTVLLLETKRKNMIDLDEDALVELHKQVQRGRNKHVKNYRRAGAAQVPQAGTRSGARRRNSKNRDRAEASEDALARVSRRLAAAARDCATQLREQRLSSASKNRHSPAPAPDGTCGPAGRGPRERRDDRSPFTPARKKRVATSAAA